MPTSFSRPLIHDHTPAGIARRLREVNEHGSLGDFVLGAVDGTVTTFAIVAGVAGADLGVGAALVLGVANVLADGFSMAAGQFLKTRADRQIVDRYRRIEEQHIRETPEGEEEEIRQIFAAKGFEGETLDRIVETITADRQRWVDTMLIEEWGLQLKPPSALRAALVTFFAFVLAGMIPLLPLFFSGRLGASTTFALSAVFTAITFTVIGGIRGRVSHHPVVHSALETLFVGGAAATVSYVVGVLLKQYVLGEP
jgi:VIT1/CCC1 family predicted Fe2+/Mn2+ transporter